MALCKTDEIRALVPEGQRLIGLDIGSKTIGLATCDAAWSVATPHSVLQRKKFTPDMDRLMALMADENIGGMVIGWPLNMDGSAGPRCDSVRDFTYALLALRKKRGLGDVAIVFEDERLSSRAVERAMLEGGLSRQQRKPRRDALAATWILQSLLDRIKCQK